MLPNRNTVHRWKSAWHVCGLLTTWLAALSPNVRAEQEIADTVAAHIDRLSSDTLAERTAAEQALIEVGPAILDLLPPHDLIDDAAARDALTRIRRRVEIEAAEQSIAPAPVSLTGTHSIEQIAHEISTQTANPLSVDRLPDSVRTQEVDVRVRECPILGGCQ